MSRLSVRIRVIVACLGLLSGPTIGVAQDTAADEVAKIKSAFLLNFARFTTWPEEAFENEQSPLTIAVVGQPRLLPYLIAIVQGETVGNRPIEVRAFPYPEVDPADPEAREQITAFFESLRRSHLVFLPRAEAGHIRETLDRLHSVAVLTVSDALGFVDDGGMLELRQWRGRVIFDANAEAIRASGVEVSSKVLRLARTVKGEERQ